MQRIKRALKIVIATTVAVLLSGSFVVVSFVVHPLMEIANSGTEPFGGTSFNRATPLDAFFLRLLLVLLSRLGSLP